MELWLQGDILGDVSPLSCFVLVKGFDSISFSNLHGNLSSTVLHAFVNELIFVALLNQIDTVVELHVPFFKNTL